MTYPLTYPCDPYDQDWRNYDYYASWIRRPLRYRYMDLKEFDTMRKSMVSLERSYERTYNV